MRFAILGSKEYPRYSGTEDTTGSGGFEAFTQSLATALKKRGCGVMVVTRRFVGLEKRERVGGVDVVRVPWIKGFWLRSASFNFFSALALLSLTYDAAVANGFLSAYAARFAKLFNNRPVIYVPAGLAATQPQYPVFVRPILWLAQAIALRISDAVVFLSDEEEKKFLNHFGFLPRNRAVIPPGVETPGKRLSKTEAAERTGLSGSPKIVFVGRLIGVKGLDYLVEAMEKVEGRLFVVGEGPARARLEKKTASLSLSKKVFFLGFKKNVFDYLRAADVFVLPSVSEGLPLTLLEALSAGTPCVVTDIGLPVKNGVQALVVPPRSPEKLAAAIRRVLDDGRLAKKLSAEGRKFVEKEFDWKKTAAGYSALAGKLAK